ncbi:MAG TPA: DUF4386 domain-containing protein [Anaerolineales bacterium]|nr:DUF4386 domain-containing protein [Anaerolineales bacterium]
MNIYRKTAIIAGILFIVATAASLVSTGFTQSILDSPDYLIKFSATENQVILGVLFQFIAAATSAAIAISLYPLLRKYNEGLALGAVGFRLIEGVFYIVGALGLLSLLSLSQEYVKAGTPAVSTFQILGTLMSAVRNWANYACGVISFCLGALMYYFVFYQSKLIPRCLSVWGIIGIAMLLSMAVLILFGQEPSGTTLLLAIPIALQEMALAVWLIVKGFNPSAIASGSAKTDTKQV